MYLTLSELRMSSTLLEIQGHMLQTAITQKTARIEAINELLKLEHAHLNEPYLTTQKILETAELNALEKELDEVDQHISECPIL